MDIGSILIGLAALIAVAFLVGQPLLDSRRQREKTLSEADRLREQRDRILATLGDLDFDHASGKIPETDYASMRAKLVADGAAVLKQLDELAPKAPAAAGADEADLERAIAARRRGAAPTTPGDDIEQAVAARRKTRAEAAGGKAGYCPKCGQAALAGDKFCAKCGAPLPAAPSMKDSA